MLLTLSVLTPALLSITNATYIVVLIDLGEDDDSEELDKTFDNEEGEEDKQRCYLDSNLSVDYLFNFSNTISSTVFSKKTSELAIDIQLPPPEFFI